MLLGLARFQITRLNKFVLDTSFHWLRLLAMLFCFSSIKYAVCLKKVGNIAVHWNPIVQVHMHHNARIYMVKLNSGVFWNAGFNVGSLKLFVVSYYWCLKGHCLKIFSAVLLVAKQSSRRRCYQVTIDCCLRISSLVTVNECPALVQFCYRKQISCPGSVGRPGTNIMVIRQISW